MDIRYGIGDIVVDEDTELPNYVQVLDTKGNGVAEAEIYYIERENVIGVGNHIKTMKSVNPEFRLEYKKV